MPSYTRARTCIATSLIACAGARPAHQRCGWGTATFSPVELFGRALAVLDVRPVSFGGAHLFNPSVAPLPLATRAVLRQEGGDPVYLVAFRYRGGFCELLCGRAPIEPPLHIRGMLCLYDRTFRELACLRDVVHEAQSARPADYGSYDVFLKTIAGRIYATSVFYGRKRKRGIRRDVAEFYLHSIDVLRRNNTITARKRWLAHADVASPASLDVNRFGKNLGIVWDGTATGPFSLLHWLDRNVADVRRGVPPLLQRPIDAVPHVGLRGRRLHHNGSPLAVDAWCPGLRLSFGHVHTDEINATARFLPLLSPLSSWAASYRGPPPGTVYIHHIVLWRHDPPHQIVATSRPFCFPSLDAPDRCDLIQFVSGYARAPGSGDLIVTYGINDCLSARVQVPMEDVLALAFQNDSAARRRWCRPPRHHGDKSPG